MLSNVHIIVDFGGKPLEQKPMSPFKGYPTYQFRDQTYFNYVQIQ